MRKFRVRVNGTDYEVEIEEIAGATPDELGIGRAPQLAPAPHVAVQPERVPARPDPADWSAPGAPAGVEVTADERPASGAGPGRVTAPLPGLVVAVRVEVGQRVSPGQTLLVLEAMKMENDIVASVGGTVREILAERGQAVAVGDLLCVIE